MSKFMLALRVMGIVTSWAGEAMEDKQITRREAVELIQRILDALGLDFSLPIDDTGDDTLSA